MRWSEDAIPLEAELTLSELRNEKAVGEKLRRWHRVRIRRYGAVVGVLLDTAEWTRLTRRLAELESEVAEYEADALRALVGERAERVFEPGRPGRAEEIFAEAEASIASAEDASGAGGARSD